MLKKTRLLSVLATAYILCTGAATADTLAPKSGASAPTTLAAESAKSGVTAAPVATKQTYADAAQVRAAQREDRRWADAEIGVTPKELTGRPQKTRQEVKAELAEYVRSGQAQRDRIYMEIGI